MSAPLIFDRKLLTRRRGRAAIVMPRHGFLLERAAEDILDRLTVVRRAFPTVLDLGAHYGLLARRIAGLPGVERVVATELAPELLSCCPRPKVLADEEALPFADAAFDLVVSALSLQHVNDLPGTLAQIRQILKPDGFMLVALLGGATLTELRQALLEAEAEVEGGASPRVAPFADVRDLGGLLQRAGFALPVADVDTVRVAYPSPLALMREVKAMGASNVLADRRSSLLRRETLVRADAIYRDRFARADGRVTATFEIITLTGWVPHESQQKPLRPGSASARLADVLGTREQPSGEKPNR